VKKTTFKYVSYTLFKGQSWGLFVLIEMFFVVFCTFLRLWLLFSFVSAQFLSLSLVKGVTMFNSVFVSIPSNSIPSLLSETSIGSESKVIVVGEEREGTEGQKLMLT